MASPRVAKLSTDAKTTARYRYGMSSEWLRAALAHPPGMSQTELARRLKPWRPAIDKSVINKSVLGKRTLSAEEMVQIARITGYPLPDIEPVDDTDGEQDRNTIPLIGYVGAGAVLVDFDPQGELERVPMVEDANDRTRALGIQGQSLGEIFEDWIVYYDDVRDAISPAMLGKLCVLGLIDGRQMVKKVRAGRVEGTYDLFSNVEPPIYGVEIEWAAVVKTMRQRRS